MRSDQSLRKLDGMEEQREYEVVLRPEAEGGFSVFVPDLPGCHTQGETREEALAMAREAIEGYLEVLQEESPPILRVERGRVVVDEPRTRGASAAFPE